MQPGWARAEALSAPHTCSRVMGRSSATSTLKARTRGLRNSSAVSCLSSHGGEVLSKPSSRAYACWAGEKVLEMGWNRADRFNVVLMKGGEWETLLV